VSSVVKKNASRRGRKESAETAEGFYPSARHPLTAQQSKGIQKKVRLNHEDHEIHERISEAQKNFVTFEIFVRFVVKNFRNPFASLAFQGKVLHAEVAKNPQRPQRFFTSRTSSPDCAAV